MGKQSGDKGPVLFITHHSDPPHGWNPVSNGRQVIKKISIGTIGILDLSYSIDLIAEGCQQFLKECI
jgi:hypothetical protein